ncbi:MAG: YHYH protein [Rhodospirillaceae bacterium]|nr:YHYH protein [Rhodospirillaceae bacterium]
MPSPPVKAHEPDLTRLRLGDERLSNGPKAGWIWACRRGKDGGGAQVRGSWIRDDGTFDFTQKAVVDGAVSWPHQFNVSILNGTRIFTTNDLPRHRSGVFPIAPGDDAYLIDRNPNPIQSQDIHVALPLNPTLAPQPSCAPGAVGILLTGVVLFNALDALGRDAVAHEVQDDCQGHPQMTGTYHYHSVTSCLEDARLADGHSALVGYAVDGFGIYGRYGEGGQALASADLDDCHGHIHRIAWDGAQVEMYHYHGTWDFPYTVGCLRGAYDMENVRAISGPPQSMARREGRPDLEAAATKLGIGFEQLRRALGPPPPDLAAAASRLGITEQELRRALGVD